MMAMFMLLMVMMIMMAQQSMRSAPAPVPPKPVAVAAAVRAPAAAPVKVVSIPVVGNADSFAKSGTEYVLKGWSCEKAIAKNIKIEIYAGGVIGKGKLIAGATANQSSEAAVSKECKTTKVAHRFVIKISEGTVKANQGKALYVYGVSISNAKNKKEIGNSGKFKTPTIQAPIPQLGNVGYSRLAGVQEIPVKVFVHRRSDGSGNEKWVNQNYLNAVFNRASTLSNVASFKVTQVVAINDSGAFNSNSQMAALYLASSMQQQGVITVVISGENTTDTAGLAWDTYSSNPQIAMRSRYNTAATQFAQASIDNTAAIFIHELGHNFGLKHSGAIYTDNYTKSAQGIQMAKNYIAQVLTPPYSWPYASTDNANNGY